MRRLRFWSLLLLFLACCVLFSPAKPAVAACSPLASDKGQSTGTIGVAEPGQYTLWVRMWAPAATSDSVFAQIDDQCPVTVDDATTGSSFVWVNFSDGKPSQSITYNLTAGNHTITLAGREAGAGVDRVLLTSNPTCVPIDAGDNCLEGGSNTAVGPTGQMQTQTQKTVPKTHKPNWWVIAVCAIIVIAAAIFIIRKYRKFIRSFSAAAQQPGVIVVTGFNELATLRQRLLHFVRHHTLIVAAWAVVTIVAITVGIVAAATNQPVFEAEAGKLSGGATVATNVDASGGKYVVFQNNPAGAGQTGGTQTGGGSKGGGSNGGTGTPGGGSGGGSTGTGGGGQTGGGSTPPTCALPKYPNASCAGVPTGTSFSKTVNTDYFATTPGQVIDSWHITGDLVIQTTGVVIKNSLIDGHVDNDSYPSVTSFTITDSTVGPATCDTQGWPSLNAHDMTATRVFLRGHQDGLDMVGDNVTVTDSLLQPCYQPPEVVGSDGFHSDGVQDQCSATCSNLTLTHNTIDSRALYKGQFMGNSALNLGSVPDGSHMRAVTLRDNQFLGGGYSTSLTWDAGVSWIITNNTWVQGTWSYGPTDSEGTCGQQIWSGNSIVTSDANFAITSTVSSQGCVN